MEADEILRRMQADQLLLHRSPSPDPPSKKVKQLDDANEYNSDDDPLWCLRMKEIRDRHAIRGIYDNAMNSLIEENATNRMIGEQSRRFRGGTEIEDEAVTMAIRSHGLATYGQDEPIPDSRDWVCDLASASAGNSEDDTDSIEETLPPGDYIGGILAKGPLTPYVHQPQSSNEDVLSHALSAAIRKKGLGTINQ